jgi:hypothetical protein
MPEMGTAGFTGAGIADITAEHIGAVTVAADGEARQWDLDF